MLSHTEIVANKINSLMYRDDRYLNTQPDDVLFNELADINQLTMPGIDDEVEVENQKQVIIKELENRGYTGVTAIKGDKNFDNPKWKVKSTGEVGYERKQEGDYILLQIKGAPSATWFNKGVLEALEGNEYWSSKKTATFEAWDENNIMLFLDLIGQENVKFDKGICYGDWGQVVFTTQDDDQTLVLQFGDVLTTDAALDAISAQLTNPYDISRSTSRPDVIFVRFEDDVIEASKKGVDEDSENILKIVTEKLDTLGVKYEMSGNKFKPFKVIYRPINKSDEWYTKFNDIIDLANLTGVVKTAKLIYANKDYRVVPQGEGDMRIYRIIEKDGREMIDMMFSSAGEAQDYANKKGLNIIHDYEGEHGELKRESNKDSGIAQVEDEGFEHNEKKKPEFSSDAKIEKQEKSIPDGAVVKLSRKNKSAIDSLQASKNTAGQMAQNFLNYLKKNNAIPSDILNMFSADDTLKEVEETLQTKGFDFNNLFISYSQDQNRFGKKEDTPKQIQLSKSYLANNLHLSPQRSYQIFSDNTVITAAILGEHTIQYKNMLIKGSFEDDQFIPEDYDIIDIPGSTLSRKTDAHNLVYANYNSLLDTGAEMIGQIKKKLLKGVYISQSRLQRVNASKVDAEGNLLEGEVEFVLTASNYASSVTLPMTIVFQAANDTLNFDETFRDNLGKVYKLNSETVKGLLE